MNTGPSGSARRRCRPLVEHGARVRREVHPSRLAVLRLDEPPELSSHGCSTRTRRGRSTFVQSSATSSPSRRPPRPRSGRRAGRRGSSSPQLRPEPLQLAVLERCLAALRGAFRLRQLLRERRHRVDVQVALADRGRQAGRELAQVAESRAARRFASAREKRHRTRGARRARSRAAGCPRSPFARARASRVRLFVRGCNSPRRRARRGSCSNSSAHS